MKAMKAISHLNCSKVKVLIIFNATISTVYVTDNNENDAHLNVPSAHGSRDSDVHLSCNHEQPFSSPGTNKPCHIRTIRKGRQYFTLSYILTLSLFKNTSNHIDSPLLVDLYFPSALSFINDSSYDIT